MPRFHLPAEHWNPEPQTLDGEEAHHCLDVMRCRPGDRIVVFDGAGAEAEAEIVATAKGSATLATLSIRRTPHPFAAITLGQAIPKGKTMDLIVQKATELGASRIVPLLTERTVVQLDDRELGKKQAKWQRVALEACKQCGQNWLPEVALPMSVDAFVRQQDGQSLRLVASLAPDAISLKSILARGNGTLPASAAVMVGPEGDFTPGELSLAQSAGFLPLSLGPVVLRSETAALHALSILGYELTPA